MITYCTSAGWRLYMITSTDARMGTVRHRTVPGQRCKGSAGHCTVPGRFYTNFHMQWWIHLYQNSPPFVQRNRLLKDWSWLWQWWRRKSTLAQDCKNFNSTFWLHVNHSQLLNGNNILSILYSFVFMFWSSEVKYVDAICTTAKTRFSSVAVRLIKHRPVPRRHQQVPRRPSADLFRDFLKFLALVRHRSMTGRAPYGSQTVSVGILRFKF